MPRVTHSWQRWSVTGSGTATCVSSACSPGPEEPGSGPQGQSVIPAALDGACGVPLLASSANSCRTTPGEAASLPGPGGRGPWARSSACNLGSQCGALEAQPVGRGSRGREGALGILGGLQGQAQAHQSSVTGGGVSCSWKFSFWKMLLKAEPLWEPLKGL